MFQQTWQGFLRVMEHVVAHLDGESSYHQLQTALRENLDRLGCEIMQLVIEAADQRLRERREERPGWVVTRRDDVKRVLSQFGMLEYRRTYFKHRQSGARRYLVDDLIGLTPHARVEPTLKARLAERATNQSYDKSGQWSDTPAWRVSAQTVMKTVRAAGRGALDGGKPKEKRRVRYLYVDADEDHVANQDGPRWQPRLVYVHEGVEQVPGRRRLKNARYFGGLYVRQTESLWQEVWRYLDARY
ncbi:MAG TPA: UPF0236 family protein, partial [Beutenbergiaceae bacterium]|nr:UPF0236 family protein [Beutenbergiaceae bacterium]